MTIEPAHPGKILKEDYLVPLKLTITEASKRLRITTKELSEIMNGHSGISPEIALKLAKAFNTTPDFWINLQDQYSL